LISPSAPTADATFQITVKTNNFCYVTLRSDGVAVSVAGTTIRITARLTCAVVGVPNPPYVFSVFAGPLPAGLYAVDYWADYNLGPISTGSQLRASASVTILERAEAIPTLIPWAAALLATLLFGITTWFARANR
jgi:hypothetical protein